jgi:hypothetical protein
MRRVDISTGTDPGVTFAQYILHPRSPNAKSLCTAVSTARSGSACLAFDCWLLGSLIVHPATLAPRL